MSQKGRVMRSVSETGVQGVKIPCLCCATFIKLTSLSWRKASNCNDKPIESVGIYEHPIKPPVAPGVDT